MQITLKEPIRENYVRDYKLPVHERVENHNIEELMDSVKNEVVNFNEFVNLVNLHHKENTPNLFLKYNYDYGDTELVFVTIRLETDEEQKKRNKAEEKAFKEDLKRFKRNKGVKKINCGCC